MVTMPEPPDDFCVTDVCKVGQGVLCCRYLTMSPSGWSCEKLTDMGRTIDRKVTAGEFTAKGDNCLGRGWR